MKKVKLKWTPIKVDFIELDQGYLFTDEIENLTSKQDRSYYYSFIGKPYKAIENYDADCNLKKYSSNVMVVDYNFIPAKEHIISVADKFRVIAINETHHNPEHRKFTELLIHDLNKKGYSALGVEALEGNYFQYVNDDVIGFPHYYHGYLVREPELANLLRSAKELNYELIAYEHPGNKGSLREKMMANNIINYLLSNENSKIIIHCGYEHNMEGQLAIGYKSMVENIKDSLNIEILTIDQTLYRQRGKSDCEHPIYSSYDKKYIGLLDRSVNDLPEKNIRGWRDFYVFHPKIEGNFKENNEFDNDDYVDIELPDLDYPAILKMYSDTNKLTSRVPDDVIEIISNDDQVRISNETKWILIEDSNRTQKLGKL